MRISRAYVCASGAAERWQQALRKHVKGIDAYSLTADESPIYEELNVAYAGKGFEKVHFLKLLFLKSKSYIIFT